MQMPRTVSALVVLIAVIVGGCASSPPAEQTGFLSDYSRLQEKDSKRMSYASPELKNYQAYMVDPIEFRVPPEKLSPAERADVARHFNKRLTQLLEKRGYAIVREPGVGVARVSIALTDVARSTWWLRLHPASRASGAGTGGAAMEAEIIDSVTGQQLAAAVQASPGTQFDITAFSTVADVNNAINKWAQQAELRLDELRAGGR